MVQQLLVKFLSFWALFFAEKGQCQYTNMFIEVGGNGL
jgi:hypothetical protein